MGLTHSSYHEIWFEYGLSPKIFSEIEKRFLAQSSVEELYFCFNSSDCSPERSLMAFLKIFFFGFFEIDCYPMNQADHPFFCLIMTHMVMRHQMNHYEVNQFYKKKLQWVDLCYNRIFHNMNLLRLIPILAVVTCQFVEYDTFLECP